MSLLGFVNFETGDLAEAVATTGSVSASTAHVNSGTYSLRCNPTGTGVGAYQLGTFNSGPSTGASLQAVAFTTGATVYFRFYVYVNSLPATGSGSDEEIFSVTDSSNALLVSLRLSQTGALEIWNASTTVNTTILSVMPAGHSYKVSLQCPLGGSGTYNVLVNGVNKLTGTGSFGSTAAANVYLGKRVNINGNGYDLYYDDFAWASGAFPNDSSGTILVPTAIYPPAGNSWIGAASNCNSIPPNAAQQIFSTTPGSFEGLSVTDPGTAGINSNSGINGVKAIAYSCWETGASGALAAGVFVNGTSYLSSSTSITSSFLPYGQFFATNPNTSAPWTFADLQSVILQVQDDNSGSNETAVDAFYLLVDYGVFVNPVTLPRPLIVRSSPEFFRRD